MLLRLSHAFFRRHPAQLLLALVGIAAGVAVVTGVALLRGVLVESLDAVSAELVDDQAVVVRHVSGRIPVEHYQALARAQGAPDWVPLIRRNVRLNGQRLELIGLDPFSAVRRLVAADGVGLAAALFPDEAGLPVALTSRATLDWLGLAPGAVVELEHAGRPLRVQLGAPLVTRPGLDRRLVMDIAEAQHLLGERGSISELLAPPEATEWIRARLGDELVLTTAPRQQADARRLTEGMRANLTAMSLLALATGMFVVYSVLSFLMVQRRRSFGLLRALGMTPGLLSRMLVLEVLLIAAFGSLLGLVAGTVLSDQLLQLVAAPVAEVYGRLPAAATQPSLLLYMAITVFALGAAVVVTVPVLRDALAIPPGRLSRGLRRAPMALTRLLLFGLLLCAAGALWVGLDSSLLAALGGLFLLLSGVILVVPRLGFGLVAVLSRLAPRSLVGRALRLLDSGRLRLSPALAALSLALALAVGMAMMILDFRATVGDWVSQLLQAEVYVSIAGRPMEQAEAERFGQLYSVRAWSFVRRARTVDQLALTAYRLPPEAWRGFSWRGAVAEQAYEDFLAGRAVLASEPLARRQQLEAGDRIGLTTPEGRLELPLAGVFRDYSSEQGFLAVSDGLYRSRFGDTAVDSIGLYLAPGTAVEEFRAALLRLEPDVRLQTITPEEVRSQTLAVFDRTFRISWALAGLVGLIALVALTSALLAQGLERAREHATLRALGLSPNRLTVLVTIQATGLTLVALLLALPLAVLIHYALTLLIQPRAFGWSLPIGVPPFEPVWLVAPAALLLGALTGLYPGWRLRHRSIVQHLRAGR
ncbi:MAG: hypothetical protein CVV18_01020 [Gammaproteobacteria bacterium HGW-Gammaproteobacteria-8]|nr:MAG: hypothetical protein CVV18_01020 [Gammaproteobacteria bacterium HGW-Gammaproteobacteria-8]